MNSIVEQDGYLFDVETGELFARLPHPVHHLADGGPVVLTELEAELVNSLVGNLMRCFPVNCVFKHHVENGRRYVDVFHGFPPSQKPSREAALAAQRAREAANMERLSQVLPARKSKPRSAFELWTDRLPKGSVVAAKPRT